MLHQRDSTRYGLEGVSRFLIELFAKVVLSGGTTFFQGIDEHMNGLTVLASSTMRSKWFYRGRICRSLRLSFFPPSTQGQLPACCKILFVSQRDCVILRILTSYALTVVLVHACQKKKVTNFGKGSRKGLTEGLRDSSRLTMSVPLWLDT